MRVGFLLRGREDVVWDTAVENVAAKLQVQGVRVNIVRPERVDPLLQSALCYRMLQLDYTVIAVRPEQPENLVKCIRAPKPVLDLGTEIPSNLMKDAPWYHALLAEPTVQDVVQAIKFLARPVQA